MADDNLFLAGSEGLTQGIKEVLVPYFLEQAKSQREAQTKERILREQQAGDIRFTGEQQRLIGEREKDVAQKESELEQIDASDLGSDLMKKLGYKSGQKVNRQIAVARINALSREQAAETRAQSKTGIGDEKEQDRFASRVKDLQALRSDLSDLKNLSDSLESGAAGAVTEIGAKVPFLGATIAPKTREYLSQRKAVAANAVRAFTGGARTSQILQSAEEKQIPDPEVKAGIKADMWKKLFSRVDNRINLLKSGRVQHDVDFYQSEKESGIVTPDQFGGQAETSLPQVGGQFQGGKVLRVRRIK